MFFVCNLKSDFQRSKKNWNTLDYKRFRINSVHTVLYSSKHIGTREYCVKWYKNFSITNDVPKLCLAELNLGMHSHLFKRGEYFHRFLKNYR